VIRFLWLFENFRRGLCLGGGQCAHIIVCHGFCRAVCLSVVIVCRVGLCRCEFQQVDLLCDILIGKVLAFHDFEDLGVFCV